MAKISLPLLIFLIISVTGCTNVIHAVTKEPIHPDPGETSLGTDLDDWQMATLIGVNIKKSHPQLEKSHLKVDTYNKVVLLTGEVPSNDMRSLAGNTARSFRGVRQVHNEIQVKGATSILSRTNDSWLTTKVTSKLIANRKVKSSHVKVVTVNGVVYLMGLVTGSEADAITAIASNTRGATKIVRVFEYIDN
jgi:osmotically-inducible protein OsmY